MRNDFKHYIYITILLILPCLFWIVKGDQLHSITFYLLGMSVIVARYWEKIKSFRDTLEYIFLFFLTEYLLSRIGLDKLFPLNHILSIFVLFFFIFKIKKYRRRDFFIVKGNIKGSAGIGILFALLAISGLSIWFILEKTGRFSAMIPNAPIYLLMPLGIGFAIINSVYEEGIFRSYFLTGFMRQAGLKTAIVLQAVWFACLHYQAGFPSGIWGVLLTFIFGLMMGYLVWKSHGILLPIIVHAVADFAVFLLVVMRLNGLF